MFSRSWAKSILVRGARSLLRVSGFCPATVTAATTTHTATPTTLWICGGSIMYKVLHTHTHRRDLGADHNSVDLPKVYTNTRIFFSTSCEVNPWGYSSLLLSRVNYNHHDRSDTRALTHLNHVDMIVPCPSVSQCWIQDCTRGLYRGEGVGYYREEKPTVTLNHMYG